MSNSNPFYREQPHEKQRKRINNTSKTRTTAVVRRIVKDSRDLQARLDQVSDLRSDSKGKESKCGSK